MNDLRKKEEAAKAIQANRSQAATSVFISNTTGDVDLAQVAEVGIWGNVDAVNISQERVDEKAKR